MCIVVTQLELNDNERVNAQILVRYRMTLRNSKKKNRPTNEKKNTIQKAQHQ